MMHANHSRDDATLGQIIGVIVVLTVLAIELAGLAVAMLLEAAS